MTETATQNGHAPAPARLDAAPSTASTARPMPDWERQRDEQLDGLDEYGPCIPFGPARPLAVFPSVAAAMLRAFYERDRRAFIELRDECEANAPLPAPPAPRRTRRKDG